jgi:hypothetical protein
LEYLVITPPALIRTNIFRRLHRSTPLPRCALSLVPEFYLGGLLDELPRSRCHLAAAVRNTAVAIPCRLSTWRHEPASSLFLDQQRR